MIDTTLLIASLAFIGIVLFTFGIFYYLDYRKMHHKLIEKIERMGRGRESEETTDTSSTDNKVVKKYFLKIISSLGNLVKSKRGSDISHLRKTFLNAGYRRQDAPVIFFGSKTFLAILLPACFFLLKFLNIKTIAHGKFMLFSILLALIGFYLPNIWLQRKIARRKEEILKGFPDALDMIVVCVEAGIGLDGAINRVGEEMKLSNKALSEEFRLFNLEMRGGKLRRDALRNLAMRTGLEEVSNLVTLLIQTDKFGTSVAQALRVHSDSLRTKRYQKAEEVAARLPVKLIFPLILFILPTLLLTLIGPAAIMIFRAFAKLKP